MQAPALALALDRSLNKDKEGQHRSRGREQCGNPLDPTSCYPILKEPVGAGGIGGDQGV